MSNTDTTEYTVKKGAMQDVEWSFWGKSQWPMAVASAVQGELNCTFLWPCVLTI